MVKSIDPILTPDLLWLLASMGHRDDLVFVDANHPATRIAQSTSWQRLIQLPGMSMETAVRAIMSVYPAAARWTRQGSDSHERSRA